MVMHMKNENLFFLVIVFTVIVIRVSVFIIPEIDVRFLGIVVHHFWFGIFPITAGFLLSKKCEYCKLFLYGIGAGLMIDEMLFMILGGGSDEEYWTIFSSIGTIVIIVLILPVRAHLLNFLLRTSILSISRSQEDETREAVTKE